MKQLKTALIGCGNISGAHGPAYKKIPEKVKLAYCCDLIPERARKRAEEFGDADTRCVTDYREVLADADVDCVSLCLPNWLHAPIAIEALNAGKDVLCEKPVALNYAQALEMQAAAEKNGRILNIGVVNRFNRAVENLRELVASGELGELYQIYCSFRAYRSIPALGGWFTTKALSGGGALIDWGVHFLDLINYVVGDIQLKTVSAAMHSKLATDMHDYVYRVMHAGPPKYDGVYDVEEYVTGLVRTQGPVLTLNGAWAQNIDEDAMFIEFMGTKAGVKLKYGGHYTVYSTKNGELVQETPDFEIPNMFDAEIEAFVDSSREHKKIRSNIDNVIITAQMMDAIYRSCETGREIVL